MSQRGPSDSGLRLRDSCLVYVGLCLSGEVVQECQPPPRASVNSIPSFSHPFSPCEEPHSAAGGPAWCLGPAGRHVWLLLFLAPTWYIPALWFPGVLLPASSRPLGMRPETPGRDAPPPASQPAHQLLSGEDAVAFQPWVRGVSRGRQDDVARTAGGWPVHPALSLRMPFAGN